MLLKLLKISIVFKRFYTPPCHFLLMGVDPILRSLSIKTSHYDKIKRKPSSTHWCLTAILSQKLHSVQGHLMGTHDLRSYHMKNLQSRKGISSVSRLANIFILIYLFSHLAPYAMETDVIFQQHVHLFMFTIQQVTDHLDDMEGDECNTTLLMLGAKHAMIPNFDALWLV